MSCKLTKVLQKGAIRDAMESPESYNTKTQPENKEGKSSYKNPLNRHFLPIGDKS